MTSFDCRSPEGHTPFECVTGDRRVPAELERLAERRFHAVFDLLSYDAPDTQAVIDAFKRRIGVLVHLSTASVYQRLNRDRATEQDVEYVATHGSSYAAGKRRAEKALESAADLEEFPAVIIRSPAVVGPGDPVSRERYLMNRIASGRPILHPGPTDARVLFVFRDDLIDALVAAATVPAAVGQAIHVCSAESPGLVDHASWIASACGLPSPRWNVRSALELVESGFHLVAFPYALGQERTLDPSLARELLGFIGKPYEVGMRDVVADWNGGSPSPSWPGTLSGQAGMCGTNEWLHADRERTLGMGDGVAVSDAMESLLDGSAIRIPWSESSRVRGAPSPDPRAPLAEVVLVPDVLGAQPLTSEQAECVDQGQFRLAATLAQGARGKRSDLWTLVTCDPLNPRQEYGHAHSVVHVRPPMGLGEHRRGDSTDGALQPLDLSAVPSSVLESDGSSWVADPSCLSPDDLNWLSTLFVFGASNARLAVHHPWLRLPELARLMARVPQGSAALASLLTVVWGTATSAGEAPNENAMAPLALGPGEALCVRGEGQWLVDLERRQVLEVSRPFADLLTLASLFRSRKRGSAASTAVQTSLGADLDRAIDHAAACLASHRRAPGGEVTLDISRTPLAPLTPKS